MTSTPLHSLDVGPSPSHVDERTAGQPVPPRGAHPLATLSTQVGLEPAVDEPSADLTVPKSALGTLPLAPSWRRTILHGLAGYGRGCRCPECRTAQKVRMAAWRQAKGAA